MSQTLTIDIGAKAVPASNKKGYNPKTGGFYDAHKGKAAQVATIRLFAQQAAKEQGWKLTDGPIWMSLHFVFTRPAGHYGSGKNAEKLKPSAPRWPKSRAIGDRTNLLKSVEDALTGIVWHDDSQVVDGPIRVSYGPAPLISIAVCELDNTLEP